MIDQKEQSECKYLAKDFVTLTGGETIKIRRGREVDFFFLFVKQTYICPLCGSEDCIDLETNVCCVCDVIVHPSIIVTCRVFILLFNDPQECSHTCSALPNLKRAPERKDDEEDPEWCEMDAFCGDMDFMVELSCGHRVCLECFAEFASVDDHFLCLIQMGCNDIKNIIYDEHTKQFGMRCFANCNLSHPLDLLRLGGDKSWKRLGEKILEYRTNLDHNRSFFWCL